MFLKNCKVDCVINAVMTSANYFLIAFLENVLKQGNLQVFCGHGKVYIFYNEGYIYFLKNCMLVVQGAVMTSAD